MTKAPPPTPPAPSPVGSDSVIPVAVVVSSPRGLSDEEQGFQTMMEDLDDEDLAALAAAAAERAAAGEDAEDDEDDEDHEG